MVCVRELVSTVDALPARSRLVLQPASVRRVLGTLPGGPRVLGPAHVDDVPGRAVQDDTSRRAAHVAPTLVRVRPGAPDAQLARPPAALGRLPPVQTRRAVRRHRRRVRRPRAVGSQSRAAPHVLRQDPQRLPLPGRPERRGAQDLGRRYCHRRRGIPTVLLITKLSFMGRAQGGIKGFMLPKLSCIVPQKGRT